MFLHREELDPSSAFDARRFDTPSVLPHICVIILRSCTLEYEPLKMDRFDCVPVVSFLPTLG